MAKKGTSPANAMRRGEIYWVDIPNAIGHELMKDRPAIIVSCDALNDNSPVVQVVYCSASPKKELPEHITIRSTEQISTASMALVIAQTERDTYKRMYESLLARMTMERESFKGVSD